MEKKRFGRIQVHFWHCFGSSVLHKGVWLRGPRAQAEVAGEGQNLGDFWEILPCPPIFCTTCSVGVTWV